MCALIRGESIQSEQCGADDRLVRRDQDPSIRCELVNASGDRLDHVRGDGTQEAPAQDDVWIRSSQFEATQGSSRERDHLLCQA